MSIFQRRWNMLMRSVWNLFEMLVGARFVLDRYNRIRHRPKIYLFIYLFIYIQKRIIFIIFFKKKKLVFFFNLSPLAINVPKRFFRISLSLPARVKRFDRDTRTSTTRFAHLVDFLRFSQIFSDFRFYFLLGSCVCTNSVVAVRGLSSLVSFVFVSVCVVDRLVFRWDHSGSFDGLFLQPSLSRWLSPSFVYRSRLSFSLFLISSVLFSFVFFLILRSDHLRTTLLLVLRSLFFTRKPFFFFPFFFLFLSVCVCVCPFRYLSLRAFPLCFVVVLVVCCVCVGL